MSGYKYYLRSRLYKNKEETNQPINDIEQKETNQPINDIEQKETISFIENKIEIEKNEISIWNYFDNLFGIFLNLYFNWTIFKKDTIVVVEDIEFEEEKKELIENNINF